MARTPELECPICDADIPLEGNEKSGDYIILFLFSMGITKGKWGTLVTELFEFKRHYDERPRLTRSSLI
jgi:arginine/lysine/ornithine decarboxylase